MKYFAINVDDEVKIGEDMKTLPPVEHVNISDGQKFIDFLTNNERFQEILNDPEYIILVFIDEHLPYSGYQGRDIYEVLGIFSKRLSQEIKMRIIPIGSTSSELGQPYMSLGNRRNKSALVKLYQVELFFKPEEYLNIGQIFKDDGYHDYETGEMVQYSDRANEAFQSEIGFN